MASAEALYNSIKSGKTKLSDLNDSGKEALRGYMNAMPKSEHSQENKQYADQMKSAYQSNPDSFNQAVPAQSTKNLAEKVQKPNILDKIFKDNPVMRVINRPFAKMAEMSVPDANYLGTNVNAREDFAKRNPMLSTGNKKVDKVADVAGSIGSIFTPIGTGGAFINDIGKGASALLASKGGQVAENIAGKLGSKAANAVNPMLNQLGINLSTNLASKSAQAALRGGTLGAGFGALEPFRTGDGNLKDVPKSVLENAAMFAAGDAALPFLGAGAKTLLDKLKPDAPLPSYEGISLTKPSGPGAGGKIEGFNAVPITADSKLDAKNMTPKERATQERIDQFTKVEDNPVIPDTSSQIQSKTIGEPLNFKKIMNNTYIKGVDNLHRTNQFDKKAAEAKGGKLNPSDQAYTLGLNARGQDMQASQLINKNFIDAKGEIVPTAQPLSAIAKQIPKGQESAFNDYVVAKHAITRMARGEKVYNDNLGMTIQKAQAIVNKYDVSHPTFKNTAAEYTKFHNDLAQHWYVDTGLFKQAQLDAATKANPNYVPNKRIFSDLEQQQRFNSKSGLTGQSKPVKRYDPSGSQRKVVNPIESSIEDVAKGVKTAKWNEAGQAVVRSLERNPEELRMFAEIVPDHPKFNVDEMIQKEGLDGVIDHINKSFEDATRNFNKDTGNVVTVLVHGEPVHIRVHDPQFLEAISNLSPQGRDYVTNAVGAATKVMKNLTTGINPVFGLTRNIFRDIPHGYISSKSTSNPAKYAYDLVGSLISVMKNGKLYNEYKNMGGGHSSPTASDRNLLAQSKEKLIPSKGIKQTLKRNLITRPYHVLENVNNAAEAAPRLAEFKRQKQLGLKQGLGQYDSKVKALYEANDLTVNFNKYGNVTKNLDAYLPYLNAATQGLDQVSRLYSKGGPKRLAQVYAKSIGAITIPSVLTYLMFHDDPDYQQVSNFTKDNYLLIGKNKDGSFIKIAKPRELGMVFGTAVERVLRNFKDEDPRAFQDFGNSFLKNFLPPGVGGSVEGFKENGIAGIPGGVLQDTIAGPLVDLERNKNFANQPIVPQDLVGASKKNQFDSKTSEPAKFIGNLLNASPKQLDFLAKSYLGVIGQLGIPSTTKGSSIKDTLKQQVTVDPVFSNDISKNFYDQKNKADIAKVDAKLEGVPNEGLSAYYDKMATLLGAIRKQQKMARTDETLTKDEKNAKIKELQKTLNRVEKEGTK